MLLNFENFGSFKWLIAHVQKHYADIFKKKIVYLIVKCF